MKVLIAIDPGSKGAIAWRDEFGRILVNDLPITTIELKGKRKDGKHKERVIVDAYALAGRLSGIVGASPFLICIEALLASAPRMSTMTALLQGANFGRIEGAAMALPQGPYDRVETIASHDWRAFHGLRGGDGERKAQAVLKALELYPHQEIVVMTRPRLTKSGKPSKRAPKAITMDGRADALLMLNYMIAKEEGRERARWAR